MAERSLICWADVETAGEDRGGLKGGLEHEVGLVLTDWDLRDEPAGVLEPEQLEKLNARLKERKLDG